MLIYVTYKYFLAEKEILTHQRAHDIIELRRGHPLPKKMSPQQIRFGYACVAADAVGRTLSKSGAITAISFVGNMPINPLLLWLGATALATTSAKVDFAYYLVPVSKNCGKQIESVVTTAQKDPAGKSRCDRVSIYGARFCSWALPCFFKEAKEDVASETKATGAHVAISMSEKGKKSDAEKQKTRAAADLVLEREKYERDALRGMCTIS